MWTTFALASEDASGQVIGRMDTTTEFTQGDVIQVETRGSGSGSRQFRVIRVLQLEQVGPERWVNRLVMVRPRYS